MEIRYVEDHDRERIERFVARIPDGDRTFFKEDAANPDVVAAWVRPGAERSVALDGDYVVGYVALVPLQAWSSHVGELRVIVDPDRRGQGIGRELARYAVLEALRRGLSKIVVEVVADQDATVAMFRSCGFHPEALLRNQVRDQTGALRDLMILAHSVDEAWSALAAAGVADTL